LKTIKKLVYLSGTYSLGSTFESALAFLFIPIYTAYLGSYEYGIVGLMSVTTALLSKCITPPVTSGFVRHYYAPNYKEKQGILLFNCLIFLLMQSLFLAAIFYSFKSVISVVVLESKDLIYIVELYALILFIQPLSQFLVTFLKHIEKARIYIIISWTAFISSAAVVLTGLIILKIGVLALIYGNLVSVFLTLLLILPVFFKYSKPKISFSIMSQPLKYGYQRILSGFSILLIETGDRYVLRIISTVSYVGLYSFGYTIAGIISVFLVTPLKNALHPIVFQQESNPEQQKKFLKFICSHFYLVGMFCCLFLSLYSKELIEFMARKEEFWESWVIVPIIAFAYLQHGLGNFFDWGLMMTKKSFYSSINVLIAAVVNLGLNFILIPLWGILGAAFATLFSYFVWNGLKLYYSAKYYDLHFDLIRLGHITIVGIGLYSLSLVIANTDSFTANILIKFFILFSYPFIFFISRFFTLEEKEYLHKLWKSIRTDGLRGTYAKIRLL
jgi:O-antigen/teichoic acid export membrane protein